MPVYKTVEYSVYCELCDNLVDLDIFRTKREAEKKWRSLGWRRTKRGWVCPLHDAVRQQVIALEKMIENTEPVYGNTVRLEIAELSRVISKEALIEWLGKNQGRAWVEGASEPVVRNVWRGKLRLLLKIDGRYFTQLFCQRSTK